MATVAKQPPTPTPLPLKSGDRLSRDEFERRYDAMPHLKKAELLEGRVYMPSPIRWNHHAGPHLDFATWLGTYRASTPGVQGGLSASVRLDLDNEPQPDGMLIVDLKLGGQARISVDDYVEQGPELAAEISASTERLDLSVKFRVYRRNRVLEYIVWRVLDQTIDWFVLRDTKYEPLPLGRGGIYRSEVFPGLWLDVAAMTAGDLSRVLKVLQQGIDSAKHTAFVARLQRAAAKKR